MGYVLGHIFGCLFVAAIIGGIVGWLLRHFAAQSRIEDINNDWSGKVDLANGERDRIALQLKEAEGSVSSWKTRFGNLETEHATVSARVPELEAAVAGWAAKAALWDRTRSQLEVDLKTCSDARSQLNLQIAEANKQLVSAQSANRALKAELDSALQQASLIEASAVKAPALEAQVADLGRKVSLLDAEYAKLAASSKAEIARYQSELANLKANSPEAAVAGWVAKAAQWDQHKAGLETDLRVAAEGRAAAEKVSARQEIEFRNTIERLRAGAASLELELRASKERYAQLQEAAAAPKAMAAVASAGIADSRVSQRRHEPFGDIERIEGIGLAYGQKLRSIGILWVKELLDRGAAAQGREEIALRTGIDRRLILKWVNAADLLRIEGITPDWAELLEESGVDTVKELRTRNAENLAAKVLETNQEGNYARLTPGLDLIRGWIEQAKSLESRVTH